jgi:hypothetical protein
MSDASLSAHMGVHDEEERKKFNCEFCDKAFRR